MATTARPQHRERTQTAATGLTLFAGVMMFIAGILDVFRGIMGIAEDDVYVSTPNYIFKFDLTSWGWINLLFGAVAVIVSFGLFIYGLYGLTGPTTAVRGNRI